MYVALVNPVVLGGPRAARYPIWDKWPFDELRLDGGAVLLDWKDLDRQICDFAPKKTLNI